MANSAYANLPLQQHLEVIKAIRPGSNSVLLHCPHCHQPNRHQAASWPQVNVDGFFIIAPTTAYGVTCNDCNEAFCFKPKAAVEPWPEGNTMDEFETLTFDPNGARDWPYTTEVESLLTVPWLREFSDGTQQFMDDDQNPVYVYSPRLPPEELERFCETHIEFYRAFYAEHERALDRRERVPMAPFW